MPKFKSSKVHFNVNLGLIAIAVAVVAVVAMVIYFAPQLGLGNVFNINVNQEGDNDGGQNPPPTSYPTPAPTGQPLEPASVTIVISKTDLNSGETLAGIVYTNRVGAEVKVYARFYGEDWVYFASGTTDVHGQVAMISPINRAGIYEFKAVLESKDSNFLSATVHGFQCDVTPDSVSLGTPITVDVFSDKASTSDVRIYYSTDSFAHVAGTVAVGSTNAGGHMRVTYTFGAVGTYQIMAYHNGQWSSNPMEWLVVS